MTPDIQVPKLLEKIHTSSAPWSIAIVINQLTENDAKTVFSALKDRGSEIFDSSQKTSCPCTDNSNSHS